MPVGVDVPPSSDGGGAESDYELYPHSAVAKVAGLPDAVIPALASGQTPTFESEEEAIAHAFTPQLVHTHRVDQNTYADAARRFGDKGVVDMVMLIGVYLTTCAIINAFEVPTPEAMTR
jgi:4-carboxymuconolactone decarboxylase